MLLPVIVTSSQPSLPAAVSRSVSWSFVGTSLRSSLRYSHWGCPEIRLPSKSDSDRDVIARLATDRIARPPGTAVFLTRSLKEDTPRVVAWYVMHARALQQQVVAIAVETRSTPWVASFRPGTRWPVYVMASGRVLLASRSDTEVRALLGRMQRKALTSRTLVKIEAILEAIRMVRQNRFALVDGELEEGLISVAVPIHNRSGDVIASLNSSSSVTRTTARKFSESVVPILQGAAREMAKIL
jgi:DNA-binding IclR family transcriptional regulator